MAGFVTSGRESLESAGKCASIVTNFRNAVLSALLEVRCVDDAKLALPHNSGHIDSVESNQRSSYGGQQQDRGGLG
jgi:hypothetical protein